MLKAVACRLVRDLTIKQLLSLLFNSASDSTEDEERYEINHKAEATDKAVYQGWHLIVIEVLKKQVLELSGQLGTDLGEL